MGICWLTIDGVSEAGSILLLEEQIVLLILVEVTNLCSKVLKMKN